MINDFTGAVRAIVDELGLTFFLSGVVPALAGVTINQYVLFAPPYTAGVWNLFPQVTRPWLGVVTGPLLTTLVLSLTVALLLIPLNLFITRVFEGLAPGFEALMSPFKAAGRRRYDRLYAPIAAARTERLELLADYEAGSDYDEEADAALQERLQTLHTAREKTDPAQALPYNPARVAPTRFGNAWAIIEEYPLARYGMDGMFFWPYMRTVLLTHNPTLADQVDSQKLLVDISLHTAFVALILAVEAVALAAIHGAGPLLIVAAAALAFFWLFYRASVQYVQAMGLLIAQSFDLYRLPLLDAFDLARPADLDQEYWTWMRLTAFLRRGEPFYFDMLARRGEADEPPMDSRPDA